MTIEILINSVDRTSDIIAESILKEDNINEQKDTLKFQVRKYGTQGFEPETNQEVEMSIDGETEFAGVILSVEKSIKSGRIVVYNVQCVDYSQHLNRKLVLERYDDQTINYIINDIVGKYAADFTVVNVDCDIEIKTVLFNRTTMTEAIDKLAKTVGYSWYVDYNKDIHFFERDDNPAPFSLTDINGMYLQDTLSITDDLSQIRNKVVIRGGEERGIEATEVYIGTSGQEAFPLAHKFAELPAVEVDAAAQDVGVDFLDKEEDFDCFWNYEQQYVRFKVDMDTKVVEISGIPLFPVIVNIIDGASTMEYGVYEFFKEDKSITSRAEALTYAQAQLEAYKDGVIEGKFQTNTLGLRSGQIINVSSDLLGIDEGFLIQRVSFRIVAKDEGIWTVVLATMRTVGIIQVLQDLLRFREMREFDPENLLTLQIFSDSAGATDVLTDISVNSPPYVWGDAGGNIGVWNFFTWY